MSDKKTNKVYSEEFKRQAVELTLDSRRSIVQIGRELGVSEASLHFWRKRYGVAAAKAGQRSGPGDPASPEELRSELRRLQKENEVLKRQRDILSLVLSTVGAGTNAELFPLAGIYKGRQ